MNEDTVWVEGARQWSLNTLSISALRKHHRVSLFLERPRLKTVLMTFNKVMMIANLTCVPVNAFIATVGFTLGNEGLVTYAVLCGIANGVISWMLMRRLVNGPG